MVKKKSSVTKKRQSSSVDYLRIERDLYTWYANVDGEWATRDESEENREFHEIGFIHQFVLNVTRYNVPGFVRNQRSGRALKYGTTDLSFSSKKFFSFVLRNYDLDIFRYSEQVELFFRLVQRRADRFLKVHDQAPYCESIDNYFEAFIDFVEEIRAELKEKVFRSLLYSRTKKVEKNFRSTQTYVNDLLLMQKEVRVFRMDLFASEIGSQSKVGLKVAQAFRENFFRNWRHNKLFESIVGYVWKLEYSPLKGFFFHCVFFVSTTEVGDDYVSAEKIGSYWTEKITKNQGAYFDCLNSVIENRKAGVGVLCKNEPENTQNLLSGLHYLFEKDLYFQFSGDHCSEKYRSYGRAE